MLEGSPLLLAPEGVRLVVFFLRIITLVEEFLQSQSSVECVHANHSAAGQKDSPLERRRASASERETLERFTTLLVSTSGVWVGLGFLRFLDTARFGTDWLTWIV